MQTIDLYLKLSKFLKQNKETKRNKKKYKRWSELGLNPSRAVRRLLSYHQTKRIVTNIRHLNKFVFDFNLDWNISLPVLQFISWNKTVLDIDRVIIYVDASTETIKYTSNRLNAENSGRWYRSVGLRKFDSLLSSSLSPARSSVMSKPVIWLVFRLIKSAGSKNVHLVIRNTVSKPRFLPIKLATDLLFAIHVKTSL